MPVIDGRGWLGGDIAGWKVLCLAAGGGRQSALYAAAGAIVTVVDLSPAMLELDRQMAQARNYDVRIVETSMDDLTMLPAEEYNLVTQPVSTCYISDLRRMYQQIARVTAPGGLYISQHKQPASLQGDVGPLVEGSQVKGYLLSEPYYRSGPLPAVEGSRHREPGTVEFLHRWEQLLGLMCRSGFVIEDLSEPDHRQLNTKTNQAASRRSVLQPESGSFQHRSRYLPPYVRVKARRKTTHTSSADRLSADALSGQPAGRLWVPS